MENVRDRTKREIDVGRKYAIQVRDAMPLSSADDADHRISNLRRPGNCCGANAGPHCRGRDQWNGRWRVQCHQILSIGLHWIQLDLAPMIMTRSWHVSCTRFGADLS